MTAPGIRRLFVGGPWHGRVELIPEDYQNYRVARPQGLVIYSRRTLLLGLTLAVHVFTPGGRTPDPYSVIDALVRATDLPVLEAP